MTVEEAIALVEQLLKRGRLTRAQEAVFRHTWEGKTYRRGKAGYWTNRITNNAFSSIA
ncbi:MAG: hypothetical protein KME21_26100 [Desmonostoc vinosum HA7617-LM4]|jgi:hypothetical protein|nr:hypothetical protein [Desmonostoc vinosum HA7617-LM4]